MLGNRVNYRFRSGLIISLGGSASDTFDSSDTEIEDDVESDEKLSGIENFAGNCIKT
jgi:hypothetical protein